MAVFPGSEDADHVLQVLQTAARQVPARRAPLLQDVLRRLSGPAQDSDVSAGGQDHQEPPHRYLRLAELYVADGAAQDATLQACHPLAGNPLLPPIFALLFHAWLFTPPNCTIPRLHLFLRGLHDLFWQDAEAFGTAYLPVHLHVWHTGLPCVLQLVEAEAPVEEPASPTFRQTPFQAVFDDLLSITCKFFLYYHDGDALTDFMSTLRPLTASRLSLSLGDLLVREARLLLEALPHGAAQERYLVHLRACAPWFPAVDVYERERLVGTLYSLMTAGGPRYSPRPTRRVAKTTLETLCPQGRWTRKYVNVAFRVLHQHYLSLLKSFVLYCWLKVVAWAAALWTFLRSLRTSPAA
eukprot:EG_transcript_15234